MYQLHFDILTKLTLYASIITDFKTEIKEVKVWNEIIELFGRRHCRVYIDILLNENSPEEFKFLSAKREKFRYYDNDYFSFYLGSTRYRKDEGVSNNIEEQAHYDYIWNLLEWILRKDNISVKANIFVIEQMEYEQEKIRRKEIDAKYNSITTATNALQLQVGQLIALKNWRNSTLRIGTVNKVVLPTRKQIFSAELSEVKKDLTAGKMNISLRGLTEIYAIINPVPLPKTTTKEQLISWIEKNEKFEALVWRRPQELWNY